MPSYKGREYMRAWHLAHPGYQTQKSKEFRERNPERQAELRNKWNAENPHKRRTGRNSWKRGGLSHEELAAVFIKQGCSCAICRVPLAFPDRKTHTDHDHATGLFRGILCCRCNVQLGHYEAWPKFYQEAQRYLDNARVE